MPQPEPVQVAFRVYASDWGLRGHGSRQIDWLVDGKLLHHDNVLFVIDQPISKEYYKALSAKYRVYDASYYGLRWLERISYADEERWTRFLSQWRPKHWVSYNDFHPRHKVRNRLLKRAGCQTWYYSHSVNLPHIYSQPDYEPWLHLEYDHLVLWNQLDAIAFDGGQQHLLGPLFASAIPDCVIAVFDTSFGDGSTTPDGTIEPYRMGTEEKFHDDLRTVLANHPNVMMLFKPKNMPPRRPDCPRFFVLPNWIDPAYVIGCADLTISLAFTSPTAEALAAGKKALWYDPLCQFRVNPYPKGVTAHTLEDLDHAVSKLTRQDCGGPAQRFRELLTT